MPLTPQPENKYTKTGRKSNAQYKYEYEQKALANKQMYEERYQRMLKRNQRRFRKDLNSHLKVHKKIWWRKLDPIVEREVAKANKKAEVKFRQYDKKIEGYKETLRRRHNAKTSYACELRKVRKRCNKLEVQNKFSKKNDLFFKRGLTWSDADGNQEKMVRWLVAFEEMRLDGELVPVELIYLITGSQMEHFSIRDINDRFGSRWTHIFGRVMGKLMRLSYMGKVLRKKRYFITPVGRRVLGDTLKKIYENKPGLLFDMEGVVI